MIVYGEQSAVKAQIITSECNKATCTVAVTGSYTTILHAYETVDSRLEYIFCGCNTCILPICLCLCNILVSSVIDPPSYM